MELHKQWLDSTLYTFPDGNSHPITDLGLDLSSAEKLIMQPRGADVAINYGLDATATATDLILPDDSTAFLSGIDNINNLKIIGTSGQTLFVIVEGWRP